MIKINYSFAPSGCQTWVRLFRWFGHYVHQCPGKPVIAKDHVLLCKRHKDCVVENGAVVIPYRKEKK